MLQSGLQRPNWLTLLSDLRLHCAQIVDYHIEKVPTSQPVSTPGLPAPKQDLLKVGAACVPLAKSLANVEEAARERRETFGACVAQLWHIHVAQAATLLIAIWLPAI